MIVRYGTKRPIKWVVASLLILSTILKSCAGSAAARSVLGVVTPGPLGLGETTTIRWSYDDGNGGKYTPMFEVNYLSLSHVSRYGTL